MYYIKTFLRLTLTLSCVLFIHLACGQSAGQDLQKASDIYDQLFRQNKNKDNPAYNLEVTQSKSKEGAAILENVSKNGTPAEKVVARWLAALLKYELAFSLFNAGDAAKAYPICKEARTEINAVAALGTPLVYYDGSTRYTFTTSEINKFRPDPQVFWQGSAYCLKNMMKQYH